MVFDIMTSINNNISSDNRKLIVGYALNPKKLRKSETSTSSNKSTAGTTITSSPLSIMTKTAIPSQPPPPPLSLSSSSTTTSSSLSSSSLSSSSSQSTTTIWKGGGLADILISNNCDDNIEFIPFDPDLDINEHPKYDIIIHKLTEDILINSDKIISLQRYLISNPKCVIIDPIDNVRKVYSI